MENKYLPLAYKIYNAHHAHLLSRTKTSPFSEQPFLRNQVIGIAFECMYQSYRNDETFQFIRI